MDLLVPLDLRRHELHHERHQVHRDAVREHTRNTYSHAETHAHDRGINERTPWRETIDGDAYTIRTNRLNSRGGEHSVERDLT